MMGFVFGLLWFGCQFNGFNGIDPSITVDGIWVGLSGDAPQSWPEYLMSAVCLMISSTMATSPAILDLLIKSMQPGRPMRTRHAGAIERSKTTTSDHGPNPSAGCSYIGFNSETGIDYYRSPFEKLAIVSLNMVAPTENEDSKWAGGASMVEHPGPLLPADTTTTTPAAFKF